MTTTTMHLSQHGIRVGAAQHRRRPVNYPMPGLAPWVGPFVWMAALALIVAGAGALALAHAGVPSGTFATIAVRVSPSDTLWSIAQANRLPGTTTAATVEIISGVNGLHDRHIVPGTVLRVPAIEAPEAASAQADGGPTAR
jgi:hypothetical protein